MSIVKANVESNYTVMTNQAAQDTHLSLESKGLLLLMVSRPSDWVFHKSQLKKECGIGTDKMNRLFSELIGRGYLCATQNFDEHGRFSKSEYILFADSSSNPAYIENTDSQPWPEKPLTDKPSTANQQLQKKDYLQKKDNTNSESVCQLKSIKEDGFNYWYKAYPKKVAKPDAEKAFKAATKKMKEEEFMEFVDFISSDSVKRYKETERQYTPAPAKYLRQELYNDE